MAPESVPRSRQLTVQNNAFMAGNRCLSQAKLTDGCCTPGRVILAALARWRPLVTLSRASSSYYTNTSGHKLPVQQLKLNQNMHYLIENTVCNQHVSHKPFCTLCRQLCCLPYQELLTVSEQCSLFSRDSSCSYASCR